MMEDAELGSYSLGLSSTNLSWTEAGVKIFRCKRQTPRGKQIVPAACKRVEAASRLSGLRFAEILAKGLVDHATMLARRARPA